MLSSPAANKGYLRNIGSKSRHFGTMFGLGLATVLGAGHSAHATVLTYFNFNDSNLVSDGGLQTSTITTALTTGYTGLAGTTVNAVGADPAGNALTISDNATANKYLQFNFSTVGYNNVTLSYAGLRGPTGFTTQNLSYSTNGTTFTSFGSYSPPTLNYNTASYNLSSVSAINNQATVYFRIDFSGSTSNLDFNGIDNMQVNASSTAPVPEPSTVALFAVGLLGVGIVGYRRRGDVGV